MQIDQVIQYFINNAYQDIDSAWGGGDPTQTFLMLKRNVKEKSFMTKLRMKKSFAVELHLL